MSLAAQRFLRPSRLPFRHFGAPFRQCSERATCGDRLDFWRVVELEPERRLRLRSLMKMPGEAELEIAVRQSGEGSVVVQTARFRPTNVLGRLYWWALYPAHIVIFGGMASRLARRAEAVR